MFISVGSKRLVNHVFIFISEKRLISLCVGCGNQIHDQYILRVSPDLEWHAACLKCAECNQYLDESCTCFVRDGKTYCKRDYIRYAIYTSSLILWDFLVSLRSLFIYFFNLVWLCLFVKFALVGTSVQKLPWKCVIKIKLCCPFHLLGKNKKPCPVVFINFVVLRLA